MYECHLKTYYYFPIVTEIEVLEISVENIFAEKWIILYNNEEEIMKFPKIEFPQTIYQIQQYYNVVIAAISPAKIPSSYKRINEI